MVTTGVLIVLVVIFQVSQLIINSSSKVKNRVFSVMAVYATSKSQIGAVRKRIRPRAVKRANGALERGKIKKCIF